jgi:actin
MKVNNIFSKTCYPSPQVITVGDQCFRCPEALFNPKLIGVLAEGSHALIYKSIMQINPDIREELYGNIVLSGGSSLFPGIEPRLQKAVASLAPAAAAANIKVLASSERKFR